MPKRILVIQGHPDATAQHGLWAKKPLSGRSARLVVTMGMPALVYRWYFHAHGLKSLQRNMLGLVGIRPVDATLIGGASNMPTARSGRWLGKLKNLGEKGD